MSKKLAISIGIVVVLAAAGGYVVLTRMAAPQQPATAPPTTEQSTPPTTAAEPTAPAAQPGAYKDYDPATVAATQGTKILFFHAQWCPQCRALEADIKANTVPSGVTIFKVNYDTAQDLRRKYEVTLQTTMVLIDDQGNWVKKYVAYDDPTLAAVINYLFG